MMDACKVGKRGTVAIPAQLRRRYGIDEGSLVITEAHDDGVLIRPAFSVEIYTDERKAEFLLSNAVDEQDYAWAVGEVRKLGIDPNAVPHRRPSVAGCIDVPTKDRPVISAVLKAKATHFITGDERDFGPYFGSAVAGMMIGRPSDYVASLSG